MKQAATTKENAFKNHLAQDWKIVHNIWSNVKNAVLDFQYDLQTLSITIDANWHEKTVASNAVLVILGLTWQTDTLNYTMYFYTRKKGPSAAWEDPAWARNGNNSGDKARYGTTIIQPLSTDGKYEYKTQKESGTLTVKRIGYFYK